MCTPASLVAISPQCFPPPEPSGAHEERNPGMLWARCASPSTELYMRGKDLQDAALWLQAEVDKESAEIKKLKKQAEDLKVRHGMRHHRVHWAGPCSAHLMWQHSQQAPCSTVQHALLHLCKRSAPCLSARAGRPHTCTVPYLFHCINLTASVPCFPLLQKDVENERKALATAKEQAQAQAQALAAAALEGARNTQMVIYGIAAVGWLTAAGVFISKKQSSDDDLDRIPQASNRAGDACADWWAVHRGEMAGCLC